MPRCTLEPFRDGWNRRGALRRYKRWVGPLTMRGNTGTSTIGVAQPDAAAVHVREIDYGDPLRLFAVFADDRYAALLDSALLTPQRGRYAFIAAEPFHVLTSKDGAIALDG